MRILLPVLLVLCFATWPASAEEVENVHIKILTPAEAAPGLRVFRSDHSGEMDREKMMALIDKALANLRAADGVIESHAGERVTIKLASGETVTRRYDAAAHAWDGEVWAVVLPQ